jgi:hypothetical protein
MNFQLSCFVTEDRGTMPFRNVGNYLSGKYDVDIPEYLNIRFFFLLKVRLISEEALDSFLLFKYTFHPGFIFFVESFNFMINLTFHQSMSDSERSFKPSCSSLLILCMQ